MAVSRITVELPRASEYFSLSELQVQTGRPVSQFAAVVLKELVDNALDAAEAAGVAPEVTVGVGRSASAWHISVADNGPGIPPEVVRRVLDFSVRVTDKGIYRSPARGAQGNALKTVVAIPFVLGAYLGVDLPVVVESCGVRHLIRARVDAVGDVQVDHRELVAATGGGTRVEVPVPAAGQEFSPVTWVRAFAVFNPHARIKMGPLFHVGAADSPCSMDVPGSAEFLPTVDFRRWRKFLPTDPTSPWWYTEQDLMRLVYGYLSAIRQGRLRDLSLREFVRQFRGLSGSARAKAVCERLPGVSRLSDLEVRPELIPVLLAAMQELSRPARADVLGWCGEEHLRCRFEELYGVKRFWYKREVVELDGVPHVVEAAVAETLRPGALFTGLNFSPTFEDPLASVELSAGDICEWGIEGFCRRAGCHPEDVEVEGRGPVAVAFHLVSPAVDFLDRAKTRLVVPPEVAECAARVLWQVCKTIHVEQKRRERAAARTERVAREREKARVRGRTLRDAVFEVLPEAMRLATGDGRYPVSARTLYYQVRPLVQRLTGRELDYNYFIPAGSGGIPEGPGPA